MAVTQEEVIRVGRAKANQSLGEKRLAQSKYKAGLERSWSGGSKPSPAQREEDTRAGAA